LSKRAVIANSTSQGVQLKSTSKANQTQILMAQNNEISQLMKFIEKLQVKVEESDKKEVIAMALQNFNKEQQLGNIEQATPYGNINEE